MKHLFILLFATIAYMGVSAQGYGRRDNSQWDRTYPYVNNGYHDPFERRLNEINRTYDNRITEVKNDYTLSNHRKRKLIREINDERAVRLKAFHKWERKEKRRLRREGYRSM